MQQLGWNGNICLGNRMGMGRMYVVTGGDGNSGMYPCSCPTTNVIFVILYPKLTALYEPQEQAQSSSWPDGIKGDLNQALVSQGLVLLTFVVFINCCLRYSHPTALANFYRT